MSTLPDKQRFKVGSTGRTLDLKVLDEDGNLPDLNDYDSVRVMWVPKHNDPDAAVELTSVELVASPTAAPNAIVTFTAAELSSANRGRRYVWVEVIASSFGTVQPPEDARGLEIEVFE